MASCVRNIRTKNYQNLVIWFSIYSRKCRGCFFETQCNSISVESLVILA